MASIKVAAVRRGWYRRLRERGEVFYVSDTLERPRWMLVLKKPESAIKHNLRKLFRRSV